MTKADLATGEKLTRYITATKTALGNLHTMPATHGDGNFILNAKELPTAIVLQMRDACRVALENELTALEKLFADL